ncbi:MAG: hypothetical protein F6K40_12285 [Okeania sp. SIO3I5]|uniref:hypothetical protein n=1 Tax=Okeania sp. SIO3I5 TaxID=2607805 RepID=UPI0013BB75EC|nr:hypothetical protein [Okeania sp. SIO3I5]NEQ37008.1 hypothetical protein [Okeania sp. SIO3I5]
MVKHRIEERIAGNLRLGLNQYNDQKIELINCNQLFQKEKEKRPFGEDFTIFFSFNNLLLVHRISALTRRDAPADELTTSESQAIANELEKQQIYTVKDGFAALLTFHIQSGLLPGAKYSSVLLYNYGTESYLPLITPYLSTDAPMTTDEDLTIYCSLYMTKPLTGINICNIFGSYEGTISYTFESGPQVHIYP